MDDLILAGALSLIGLFTAAVLAVAAAVFTLGELYSAAVAGDTGRVVIILALVFLIVGAYTGHRSLAAEDRPYLIGIAAGSPGSGWRGFIYAVSRPK